jgi:hypothetical protein
MTDLTDASRAWVSFVLQVERGPARTPGRPLADIAGRVENLDSGEWCRFRSARELLRFLRGAAATDRAGRG